MQFAVHWTKDLQNANGASFTADETTTYVYDQNDRLTRETFDGAADTTTFYAYGGTEQTGQAVYNGIQENEPASGATKATTYAYNVQGRLESVTIVEGATTTVTSYKYNHDGVRVEQTVQANADPATTTVYHINPQNHTGYAKAIEEIVEGTLARSYAIGHMIISQASAAGAVLQLLHDGHGSTRALVDALGAIIERYAYEAYGATLPGANLTQASTAQTTWLFANDGQYDPASALTYHIARWRDGAWFLTRDPYAGNLMDPISLHKRLYAHGNPIWGTDPTGMSVLADVSAAFSGFATMIAAQFGVTVAAAEAGIAAVAGFTFLSGTAIILHEFPGILDGIAAGVDGAAEAMSKVLTKTREVTEAIANAVAEAATATARAAATLQRLPMYPIIRSLGPTIYAFDVAALAANPQWYMLRYNGVYSAQTAANRTWVENKWGKLRNRAGFFDQLDEFPYASTSLGGARGPAWGRMVPAHENAVQGGLLSAFYRYSLGGAPLPFLVVPVPI